MVPLVEIAPQVQVPGHGSAQALLARLDVSGVSVLKAVAA